MVTINFRKSIFVYGLILVLLSTGVLFIINRKKRVAENQKIYQISDIESNQKLNGREIKVQAVVFLLSDIDKTLFYVVDLKLANKLNSPECGLHNLPVQYKGLIPLQGSKIEMIGKSSGLFSNGTLKFEASFIRLLE